MTLNIPRSLADLGTYTCDLTLVAQEEVATYSQFIDFVNDQRSLNHTWILASIPRPSTPSYGPISTLSFLLGTLKGSWPVLELQRAYTELWSLLPEEAKAGRGPPAARKLLHEVSRQCKISYSSLNDLFHPSTSTPAIIDPETNRAVHHDQLSSIVHRFSLPLPQVVKGRKPVVAISLPNGPLLALTTLATATYYTAAPIAHGNGIGVEQFKADVLQSKSNTLLASAQDMQRLRLRDTWLSDAGIRVLLVDLSNELQLVIRDLNGSIISQDSTMSKPKPNSADDIGVLLFTSGTSGTKKLVPLTVHSLVCGAAMVIKTWGLSPSMRCLNQMPLNHVGGLVRNLFAPIMSGGSVICCGTFDANLFWDCVEEFAPTWYYASPSMHQCILEAGLERPESITKSRIKLICNAAGGLLPSLAVRLHQTFSTDQVECTVLPSYGMTECMPISTPPLNYRLERTGTSGISVGPEISILNGHDEYETAGTVGKVCVRGAPVFSGYLRANDVIDKSCFNKSGWFDTGDLGYLDMDGYLYITGRSKEVINRGGELISPFEVEEAIVAAASNPESPTYGRVSKALAFSVKHDVLQEVVGVAIVTPKGSRRPCLRTLQDSLKSALNQIKIPVVMVFMEGGVPTNNNKILRIGLAERLGLPEFSDNMPEAKRYFDAVCPPVNTSLSVHITCRMLQSSHEELETECKLVVPSHVDVHVRTDASGLYPELLFAPRTHSGALLDGATLSDNTRDLWNRLHGYNIPRKVFYTAEPFPRDARGQVDEALLNDMLTTWKRPAAAEDLPSTEGKVASIFSHILNVPLSEITGASDFFGLGGNSMAAGRLLSALRKKFHLRLQIDVLFSYRHVAELARLINEKLGNEEADSNEAGVGEVPALLPSCEKTCSSTNPIVLFLQLIPLGLVYPMKHALTWTVFIYFLTYTQTWDTNDIIPGRLLDLVVSMIIGRVFTRVASPLVAILVKWTLMGRHKGGIYPMWGTYHTRWWLTQKIVGVCGMGVFAHFNWSRILYYRMLGMKIGRYVIINKGATLGEWDLITIKDNAVLERCTVRPFAVERNTSMYLGRIIIGHNASVGLASHVAAGTTVPTNACIGPNSSSWEISDATDANRDLGQSQVPGAHWALTLFLGLPILVITMFVGALPWLGCLVALVMNMPATSVVDELRVILIWFASPKRVAFHYCALAANAALGPLFFFTTAVIFKKAFDLALGKLGPSSPNSRSQMTRFRRQLYNTLMPAPRFHNVASLFGGHYSVTSSLARALGAKVGDRVYWPGTGPSVQDWDLLEIGDDVVFGSRAHLVTSDGIGSDRIRIKAGAMVADRVVLLPGVEVGEKTVLGSGALTKRNHQYPSDSTWMGSRHGEAVCLSTDTPAPIPTKAEKAWLNQSWQSHNSSRTTLVKEKDGSDTSSLDLNDHQRRLSSYEGAESAGVTNGARVSVNEQNLGAESHALPPPTPISPFPILSSSPFGRAFYQGQASYRVWSQLEVIVYCFLITIATKVFWNVSSISAVQVLGWIMRKRNSLYWHFLERTVWWRPFALYAFFTALIVGIMAAQSIMVIFFTIIAKWAIMGRRRPGNYDWDK